MPVMWRAKGHDRVLPESWSAQVGRSGKPVLRHGVGALVFRAVRRRHAVVLDSCGSTPKERSNSPLLHARLHAIWRAQPPRGRAASAIGKSPRLVYEAIPLPLFFSRLSLRRALQPQPSSASLAPALGRQGDKRPLLTRP